MKVSIFINKHEHKRDIPVSWDQVTFGDFLKLDECGNDVIKVIALLTRIDYEQLKKAKIVNFDQVVYILSFLNKPVTPPDITTINSIYGYPIPKNLEFEQVQQFIDLKKYVSESEKLEPIKKLEMYAMFCAVYACPHRWGKYDWQLAERMKDVFLNAPCTEVLAVGNFTLLRLIGLNLSINPTSLKADTRIKKFKLALKGFLILMVSRFRLITLWKKLGLKKTNY